MERNSPISGYLLEERGQNLLLQKGVGMEKNDCIIQESQTVVLEVEDDYQSSLEHNWNLNGVGEGDQTSQLQDNEQQIAKDPQSSGMQKTPSDVAVQQSRISRQQSLMARRHSRMARKHSGMASRQSIMTSQSNSNAKRRDVHSQRSSVSVKHPGGTSRRQSNTGRRRSSMARRRSSRGGRRRSSMARQHSGKAGRPNEIQKKSASKPKRKKKKKTHEPALVYAARHVLMLFIPVTLCMLFVVTSVSLSGVYSEQKQFLPYTPFHAETKDTGTKIWQTAANTAILLVIIMFMTMLLLYLYKKEYYKFISGWLYLSSGVLLFLFTAEYLGQMCRTVNMPLSTLTIIFVVWNFGVGGLICIHWKGPLILQQAYLIVISGIVALAAIRYMPDWTAWAVLGMLVFWDLIAVLCPKGPLRVLVETAEARDQPVFPSLIYSSTMIRKIVMTGEPQPQMRKKRKPSLGSAQGAPQDISNHAVTIGDMDNRKVNANDVEMQSENVSPSNSPSRQAVSPQTFTSSRRGSCVDEEECVKDKKAKEEVCKSHLGPVEGEKSSEMKTNLILDDKAISPLREIIPLQKFTPDKKGSCVDEKYKRRKSKERSSERKRSLILDDEEGLSLGLGDFIFYSVLVGKASIRGDWGITLTCVIAILIGLCCTLIILALANKALPALPISLTFGLVFYGGAVTVVQPFMEALAYKQIYI